jgi:hypothetical protein
MGLTIGGLGDAGSSRAAWPARRAALDVRVACPTGGPRRRTTQPCAHLEQPHSTILASPGFCLPFFGCQFPDKTETGNSNPSCRAVVVPTEPGDTWVPSAHVRPILLLCKCLSHWGRSLSGGGHTLKLARPGPGLHKQHPRKKTARTHTQRRTCARAHTHTHTCTHTHESSRSLSLWGTMARAVVEGRARRFGCRLKLVALVKVGSVHVQADLTRRPRWPVSS